MPFTRSERLVSMVQELLNVEDGLSDREIKFLDDICERESFSDKQGDWIELVWNRVLG